MFTTITFMDYLSTKTGEKIPRINSNKSNFPTPMTAFLWSSQSKIVKKIDLPGNPPPLQWTVFYCHLKKSWLLRKDHKRCSINYKWAAHRISFTKKPNLNNFHEFSNIRDSCYLMMGFVYVKIIWIHKLKVVEGLGTI